MDQADKEIELLTVTQVASLLKIGRTKAYEMAASGQMPVIRIGRSVRVPRQQLVVYLAAKTFRGDHL